LAGRVVCPHEAVVHRVPDDPERWQRHGEVAHNVPVDANLGHIPIVFQDFSEAPKAQPKHRKLCAERQYNVPALGVKPVLKLTPLIEGELRNDAKRLRGRVSALKKRLRAARTLNQSAKGRVFWRKIQKTECDLLAKI